MGLPHQSDEPVVTGAINRLQTSDNAMQQISTTILADLVAKRRKCLTQLRDLATRQMEMIVGGEMAELLRLVSAKQQLIVALQAIERQLAPFHEEDPDRRQWESAAARARCADDAEACRTLVQEVMALEQSGERLMIDRRDAVASQLRTAAAGSRVRDAYSAQAR
jgi:flagellar biosynthesis/type III secretory pathway chaperone